MNLPNEQDLLEEYKQYQNKKIGNLASLLPSRPFQTGPTKEQFSIIEDVLILCSASSEGRKMLFGRLSEDLSGDPLQLQFWEKIVEILKFQRKPEELKSRYLKRIQVLHPEVLDQLKQLLESNQYDVYLEYERNQKGHQIIKEVFDQETIIKARRLKEQEQMDTKKEDEQQQFSGKEVINVETSQYRYMTESYVFEKDIVEKLTNNPKQKHITYDWIDAIISQIKYIQLQVKAELALTQKEIKFVEEFSKQQHQIQKDLNLKQFYLLQSQPCNPTTQQQEQIYDIEQCVRSQSDST